MTSYPVTQIHLPVLKKCCGCVTDLKTAAAIIAVLGVVTSPAVSWVIVRHSYLIRMSCFISSSGGRADIVDINLNNVLSFGFGANAGLGPSCLNPKNTTTTTESVFRASDNGKKPNSCYVNAVRLTGWAILIADIIFLCFSLHFLYKLFAPEEGHAAMRFIVSCIVSVTLSFIYGMLYVGACVIVGGAFPLIEFLFCFVDVILWTYFLLVVRSYKKSYTQDVGHRF